MGSLLKPAVRIRCLLFDAISSNENQRHFLLHTPPPHTPQILKIVCNFILFFFYFTFTSSFLFCFFLYCGVAIKCFLLYSIFSRPGLIVPESACNPNYVFCSFCVTFYLLTHGKGREVYWKTSNGSATFYVIFFY